MAPNATTRLHLPVATTGQLGPALKRLRRDKGWSQAQLGQRLGISQERVSAIEAHPERVNLDTIFNVLLALGAEFVLQTRDGAPPAPQDKAPW